MKFSLSHGLVGAVVLAGSVAAAVAAPPSAKQNPLRVSMVASAGNASGFLGALDITITNTSRHTVRVPRWELPSDFVEAKLFQVTRDGVPVQYTGPMIKRGLPGPSEFAVLRAGESYRTTVDLSGAYDMAKTGQYVVRFASPLQHASLSTGEMLKQRNGVPMVAQSAPLSLWVDGSDQLGLAKADRSNKGKPCNPNKQDCGGGGGGGSGITYVGCSATQISGAGNAVTAARNYTENAKGYLNAGTVGPRYTTWFGSYTSTRYNTVQQNFVAIDAAMDQNDGSIKINCGCNQNYYAYVYPTRPYEIFVCRAFWSAPTTGTDSKAGTLVHEMSHFNVVAGTDDHVYGQSGAKSLAISDPNRAVDNADNHEYFAENTPSQN
jgi:peptidyl-Lys metalloendopeptidase